VLDLLVIISFGSAVLVVLIMQYLDVPMDIIGTVLSFWNFGIVGLWSFYYNCPESLHRFYLVVLNAVMVCAYRKNT